MADLVVDASLASAWCFPDERKDYANAVLHVVSSSSSIAIAPRLWAYEVRNSVLMGLRRGRISKADAEAFLYSLADLNIRLTDPARMTQYSGWQTKVPDRLRRRLFGSCHPPRCSTRQP
jgi:predicted nucleic acid-binding protein